MALPNPCRIKGVFFVHFAEFLTAHHGRDAVERVAKAVSPDAAQALRSPFGFEWYPMSSAVELERAAIDAFYAGNTSHAERFGRFDLQRSLNTIYRFLFRLLDPDTLILRAGRVWSQYYDSGSVTAEKTGPHRCVIKVFDFNPIDAVHCHEIRGGLLGALDAADVRTGAVEHKECVLDGKSACVFDVRW
jgi:hypothetical protein